MSKYWNIRKDFSYYREMRRLVRRYIPDQGSTLIDVGAGVQAGCKFLDTLKMYQRTAFENVRGEVKLEGVTNVCGDIYNLSKQVGRFDIVICSQCLEHLEHPASAVEELFKVANKLVILSVPYKWRAGMEPGHIQDPVDEHDVFRWTKRIPTESLIVYDKPLRRLVLVYDLRNSDIIYEAVAAGEVREEKSVLHSEQDVLQSFKDGSAMLSDQLLSGQESELGNTVSFEGDPSSQPESD